MRGSAMGATRGGMIVAALALGLTGAAAARDMDRAPHGAKAPGGYPKGFSQPGFASDARVSGRPGPYLWPVGERYRAESRPYFGRAY